jgi:hypothetical protein
MEGEWSGRGGRLKDGHKKVMVKDCVRIEGRRRKWKKYKVNLEGV